MPLGNYLGSMLTTIVSVFSPPMPHPRPFPDAGKGAISRDIMGKPKRGASLDKLPNSPAEALPLSNWRGVGGEVKKEVLYVLKNQIFDSS